MRYPTNEATYGNNAADLLELRLSADADDLWVLARMNTLKVPDATVVAIGLDTDRKSSTGGGAWPYSAGLSVAGIDRVITLWGSSGTVTRLPARSSARVPEVAANTSNDNNAIEARIPRSMIGNDRTLRVWAATGLWNKAASEWIAASPGSPTPESPGGGSPLVPARAFNVAFRDKETGSFMEERQGTALRAGDIEPFHVDVDLAFLAAGGSKRYRVSPGRFYSVIQDQQLSIPPLHEGMSYDGIPGRFAGLAGTLAQRFNYYGRHQPYGLYVPSTYGGRKLHPAAFALHGHGGSHSTYNTQPGFLADMGEGDGTRDRPPMFLITPLARGSSFYADWGEADTLAVLDDVLRRFPIDQSRLYITGYSMGGYGVYRLASLYPDLFAGAAVWAGYTGEFLGVYLTDPAGIVGDPTGLSDTVGGAVRSLVAPLGIGGGRQGKANIGNPVDTLENLRHLPLVHLAGTNDEIVPTTGQYAAPRRLSELGYRSRFDLYPGYEHFSFAIVDDWKHVREWLGNARRETTPRNITYKFSDGWTLPGIASKLRLVHGNAWWLQDLKMRKSTNDALTLATASATSRAIPAHLTTVNGQTTTVQTPTPHIEQDVFWAHAGRAPVSNRLDLRLDGVGRASIDTKRARLRPCGLVVGLRSDGPGRIRLLGAFPSGARIVGLGGVTGRVERGAMVLDVRGPVDGKASVRCPRMTR